MSETLTAPGILTRAADILAAQGWTQQGGYQDTPGLEPQDCPLDLGTAMAKAAGIDIHSIAATSPTGVHADAVLRLAAHVIPEYEPTLLPVGQRFDALINWQDEPGRTAEEVIAALRAAADAATAETPDLPAAQDLSAAISTAVTAYIGAVRDALTGTGIDLDDQWRQTSDTPPTARIHTTHHRNGDAWRESAVVEWHGQLGWSVGWFSNTMGGGTVHDRAWLGIGVTTDPARVAGAVQAWFSTPERFNPEPGPRSSWDGPRVLVSIYGTAQPPAVQEPAGLVEELQQLRGAMATGGLNGTGHKRAAELILATCGDEFIQHDLAAALVHATLAGNADQVLRLERELAEARQALLDSANEVVDGDFERASLRLRLADAEGEAARLRDKAREETERGDRWADRARELRDRYEPQAAVAVQSDDTQGDEQ